MFRSALMVLMLLLTTAVDAQTPIETTNGHLVLRMRLEKTIFRVDVLDLELQLGNGAELEARHWLTSAEWNDTLADSLANSLAHLTEATVEITFLRNVGLKRFLKSIDDSMGKAVRIGWLSHADFERISKELPDSYSFLEEKGIRDGDRLLYEVQGDRLRIRYLDADGHLCLDEVDVGPERRLALLGSYFAPGSDFREGLLRSARERTEAP